MEDWAGGYFQLRALLLYILPLPHLVRNSPFSSAPQLDSANSNDKKFSIEDMEVITSACMRSIFLISVLICACLGACLESGETGVTLPIS